MRPLGLISVLTVLLFLPSISQSRIVTFDEMKEALPDTFRALGEPEFREAVDYLNEIHSRTTDRPIVSQGRLTLTSGTPITTNDLADQTIIYFTPFGGNLISLYNGTRWQVYTFSETSVAVPNTTFKNFDIFGYVTNNTFTLETVNWTNDSTRAVALTQQNGVYVKSGSTTKRYLGTGRTEDLGEVQDSAVSRYFWNMYNRRSRPLLNYNGAGFYGYQSSSWRDSAASSWGVDLVVGTGEALVELNNTWAGTLSDANGTMEIGISDNSTAAILSSNIGRFIVGNILNYFAGTTSVRDYPTAGYHFYREMEKSDDSYSASFGSSEGNCGGTGTECIRSGLSGFVNG